LPGPLKSPGRVVLRRFRDLYATWLGERRFQAIFGHLLVCRAARRGYVEEREREIPGRDFGRTL
jgi:hypothetical protein